MSIKLVNCGSRRLVLCRTVSVADHTFTYTSHHDHIDENRSLSESSSLSHESASSLQGLTTRRYYNDDIKLYNNSRDDLEKFNAMVSSVELLNGSKHVDTGTSSGTSKEIENHIMTPQKSEICISPVQDDHKYMEYIDISDIPHNEQKQITHHNGLVVSNLAMTTSATISSAQLAVKDRKRTAIAAGPNRFFAPLTRESTVNLNLYGTRGKHWKDCGSPVSQCGSPSRRRGSVVSNISGIGKISGMGKISGGISNHNRIKSEEYSHTPRERPSDSPNNKYTSNFSKIRVQKLDGTTSAEQHPWYFNLPPPDEGIPCTKPWAWRQIMQSSRDPRSYCISGVTSTQSNLKNKKTFTPLVLVKKNNLS